MTAITILPVAKPRLVHRPYIFLAVLQVLDVLTTGIILNFYTGHAQEGNPIARVLTDLGPVGLVILLVLKLGTVALLWHCQTRVRLATALYGLVIVNNALFLLAMLGLVRL